MHGGQIQKRRLERERITRREAETIAEKGLRDLYERQRQLQLLEHVAAASNQMGMVKEVLQFAIERICAFADWKLGHAFLVVNQMLRSAGAWHVADPSQTASFRMATEAAEFAPGVGLPGRALTTGRPVWIAGLAGDGNFPRQRFAERCGLSSGIAFPVLSGAEVVAVVEFYGLEPRAPDTALIDLMSQTGTQLGRVIEHQRARERLEAQTIELSAARDEAKAADKAKSAFLANMSHELRTPLNAIIGFSDMMIAGIYGPLVDKYAEYTRDIRPSGVHLKDILNDILDISKIDAGSMELHREFVSLTQIGEACRRIIAPLAETSAVNLSFAIPEDLPRFNLDPTRFKQSLLNIVSNAVKFTPPGGGVLVDAALDGDDCIVSVTDTGIGMKAEDIELAVQPFRQIDSALNRRFEGTGLGLPLAKVLLESHGGCLVIETEPGLGTTVRLCLPISLLAQAA